MYGNDGVATFIGGTGPDVMNAANPFTTDTNAATFIGGAGDDWMNGGSNGANVFIGGSAGTDYMNSGNGNSTFTFSQGPSLQSASGGSGNDHYSYASGDGSVIINDGGGTNVLYLGGGLTKANVTFSENGNPNDLYITDGTAGDQVEILNEEIYASPPQIQTIVFSDGSTLALGAGGYAISGSSPNIYGTNGNDTLIATSGTQSLNGEGGVNTFIGGNGTELFDGSSGTSAVVIFGQGTQTAIGGSGNDTYSYAAGDGAAYLDTHSSTLGTLVLSGISLSAAQVSSASGNPVITDGVAGDQIELWDDSNGYAVDRIIFGDGTTFTPTALAQTVTASGSGFFHGNFGNDTLIGGAGAETLNGEGGADSFIAGTGTETLIGSDLNDAYSIGRGAGTDTILDSGGTDSLAFGAGVADDQLWFAQSGNDLLVSVIGTTTSVTIKSWFSGSANQIETIQTSDGHSLQSSQVANLVNAMSSLSPPPLGQTTLTGDEAGQLEPVIAANWS